MGKDGGRPRWSRAAVWHTRATVLRHRSEFPRTAARAASRPVWARAVAGLCALCVLLLAVGAGGCTTGRQDSRPPATSAAGVLQTDGAHLLYRGRDIKLYGYTFYPATAGSTAAWRNPFFTGYIEHMLNLCVAAVTNHP